MNISSVGGGYTNLPNLGLENVPGQANADAASLYKQIQQGQTGGSDNSGKQSDQEAETNKQSLVDKARDAWLSKIKSEEEDEQEELQKKQLAESQQESKPATTQLAQRKMVVEEELARQRLFMSTNEDAGPHFNQHLFRPGGDQGLSEQTKSMFSHA